MPVSRITQSLIQRNSLEGLQAGLARMQRVQEQLSSGRLVNRPSDSPVATGSAMQFRVEVRRTEQYARNAQDGLAWLGTADDALTTMLGVVGRARELVLRGINATMGPAEREALAAEVDSLRANAVDLANTRYLDRPVFAGNAAVDRAYDTAGAYQGSGLPESVERTVASGLSVRVNLTGPEIFGPPGADLFADLAAVADHLRTDPSQLDADIGVLDNRLLAVQNQLATVGARYHQVEVMRDRADAQLLTLTGSLSEVENIDLPKTIVDLQLQEVAYQAALSATARVIQPSLLDFLR